MTTQPNKQRKTGKKTKASVKATPRLRAISANPPVMTTPQVLPPVMATPQVRAVNQNPPGTMILVESDIFNEITPVPTPTGTARASEVF